MYQSSTSMGGRNVETVWASLKNAFQEIQKKNNSKVSFDQLYGNAYYMVVHKYGNRLYNGVRDVVSKHLKQKVLLNLIQSVNNNFLVKLNQAWNDHQTSMIMIRDMLMYLDRMYVEQEGKDNVFNMGLILFRDEIIKNIEIKKVSSDIIMDMIQTERSGEVINHLLIKNICQMLISLSINTPSLYEDLIEKPFLAQSVSFYNLESQKLLGENKVGVYIKKVEAYLQAEIGRCDLYLEKSTEANIIKIVEDELIKKNMQAIADMENSGIAYMIKNSKTEDLIRLYNLFSRCEEEGRSVIADAMSACLLEQGRMLVIEEEMNVINPITFIQKLLDLKNQFEQILHYSFKGDEMIEVLITTAFQHFINLNKKSPECLSLYINDKLEKGTKHMNEHEIEAVLEKTMILFRFLSDKDIFERFYELHLAKRLLQKKYVSDDNEKNMISKFKNECGYNYTLKLERILKDMSISNTVMKEFKDHVNNNDSTQCKIELDMHVLTMGYWPINSTDLSCNIPVAPSEAFEYFKKYYLKQRTGRKLMLQPQMGMADINSLFYGKKFNDEKCVTGQNVNSSTSNVQLPKITRKHLLQVPTYQMCILLLFNNREFLTYSDIQQETDIPEKKLVQSLQSLCLPKQAILIRQSNTQTENIAATDKFYVNDAFIHKSTKIKIQTVGGKDNSEAERKKTTAKVDEERKHEIDAALVRIMKERKRMTHNLLVAEVTSHLKTRFLPSPVFIKKRIENLIEREYLERTPEDKKIYLYLA